MALFFCQFSILCLSVPLHSTITDAKEQVRLMNEAEKEDSAKFNIELCAGTDLVMNEQRRVNYPLSKANGLPASSTSQPTISTGVNSGSPCPTQ